MSVLEFVSRLVEALAWPIALTVGLLILRKPVGRLIDRMRALRTPNGSLEFGTKLAQVESKVDNLLGSPELQGTTEGPSAPDYSLDGLTVRDAPDPSLVVLSAWESLQDRLMKFHAHETDSTRATRDVRGILHDLREKGLVNNLFVESVTALRDLRNSVAHATVVPTEASAATYRAQSIELVRAMDALEKVRSSLDRGNNK